MRQQVASTVVKLVIWSLIVGTILGVTGANPLSFWRGAVHAVVETVETVFGLGIEGITTAGRYLLIGAVVVVPIWLVGIVLRRARGSARPTSTGKDSDPAA